MIAKNKVKYSSIVAAGIFVASFFSNIVPCRIAADLPNPQFNWALCTLNPDLAISATGKTIYFGMTESLLQTYLIVAVGTFLITFGLLSILTKKINKGG
jgi:hypothetical protein